MTVLTQTWDTASLCSKLEKVMTKMSKYEYLRELWPKYRTAGKAQKGQLLNDFCEFTGYHRKYAMALLAAPLRAPKKRSGVGNGSTTKRSSMPCCPFGERRTRSVVNGFSRSFPRCVTSSSPAES